MVCHRECPVLIIDLRISNIRKQTYCTMKQNIAQLRTHVADDFVDRRTTTLWEVVIVEWRRVSPSCKSCLVYDSIDFISDET